MAGFFGEIGDFIAQNARAFVLTAAVAYLLGSISSAVIFSRLFTGKDVRTQGSGNAGMTNVLRSSGKLPGILTAVGDVAKVAIAIVIGRLLFQYLGAADISMDTRMLYATSVSYTHLPWSFSPFCDKRPGSSQKRKNFLDKARSRRYNIVSWYMR